MAADIPPVGFARQTPQDALSNEDISVFVKAAQVLTGGLKLNDWFYITDNGQSLLFCPKPTKNPPLGSNDDLLDVAKITDALLGNPGAFCDLKTSFWQRYAHTLCASHICIETDGGAGFDINKSIFTDDIPVKPHMLFLAALNSRHSMLPFTFSISGAKFVKDEAEAASIKRVMKRLQARMDSDPGEESRDDIAIQILRGGGDDER